MSAEFLLVFQDFIPGAIPGQKFHMNTCHDVSFEAFTVVMFQFEVFWLVMPCSGAVGYQHFSGPCCLHLPTRGRLRLETLQFSSRYNAKKKNYRVRFNKCPKWPTSAWLHNLTRSLKESVTLRVHLALTMFFM
jgi:hypothetical protein